MRKKILAFVFAAAVLMAMAVPLFGGVGTAEAILNPNVPIDCGNANSSEAAGGDATKGLRHSSSSLTRKSYIDPRIAKEKNQSVLLPIVAAEPFSGSRLTAECEYCGEFFEPTRPDRRYCNRRCSRNHLRRRKGSEVPR